jgi:polar amino acid transport system permease protein
MPWFEQFLQSVVQQWGPVLLEGALVTLQISLGAFVLGLLIGLVVAMAKLNGRAPVVVVANVYITVCRAVPELLLILLLYYAGSDLVNAVLEWMGREPVEINGFVSGVVVLGIVQGAYASEIIRGAILAIPAGHIEAARAFGCSKGLIVRRILIPEMMPFALAGLSNLWMTLLKDSALISVVGYNELLFTAKQAAGSTKMYLLFYLSVGAMYLVITLLSNGVVARIESRFRRWMPAH